MSGHESDHWTADEELLRRFVLGRLSGEQTKKLEEHLAGCSQCRNAVDTERRIAAAAKALGRSELKMRLKNSLGDRRRRVSIETYSAAALVLIAVGIAWMSGVFETPSEVTSVAETQPIGIEERKRNEIDAESYRRAEKGVGTRRLKKDSQDKKEGGASLDMPERTLADAGTGAEERVVADAVEAEQTEIAAAPAAQPSPVSSIWIEGMELEGAEPGRTSEALQASKMGEAKMKGEVAAKAITREPLAQTQRQPIEVQQRLTSELPPLQQQWQQQRRSVQALIERSDGQVRMTVYTDRAIEASDRPPVVQQVRDDSLVVIVGRQRIGFRLPQSWTR